MFIFRILRAKIHVYQMLHFAPRVM